MALNTTNAYGKITVSNESIACVAGYIARDCYGVIDLVSQGFFDNFDEKLKNGIHFINGTREKEKTVK